MARIWRILQLSDPHLLADPQGLVRGRQPLPCLRHGLQQADRQLQQAAAAADLLLISGDLCDDESWGGYVQLRRLLDDHDRPVALLAGNHDHPSLLQAVLGRRAVIAPASLRLGDWEVLLLHSHRAAAVDGALGPRQLAWLETVLAAGDAPAVVALHHPPLPIGDPFLDSIALADGEALLSLLRRFPRVRLVLFGHIHQHWQGVDPAGSGLRLLGCPSTLCPFGPVQPCPLGRSADPGGRLLELGEGGEIRQRLLRWSPPEGPSVAPCPRFSPLPGAPA